MLIFARALHMNTDIDPGDEARMSASDKGIPIKKCPIRRRRRRNANHVPSVILGMPKSQSVYTMTNHLRRS
jgi:hypothetical protein